MKIFKIYCDESRQNIGQYMLVGGIWIRQEKGWDFVNDFEYHCKKNIGLHMPMKNMKWTKIPRSDEDRYYEAYKYLVDLYFEYNKNKDMFFRTLVTDRSKYDCRHPVYYEGDYERGFYNLYCQLLLYWLEKDAQYHIRLAQRTIKKASADDCEHLRLQFLLDKLNTKFCKRISKDYRPTSLNPVLTIEPRAASDRRIIQIADILMGAVGFYWNGDHLLGKIRKGKVSIAKHIANHLNREDLCFETDWRDKTFNIFNFDTDKTKK